MSDINGFVETTYKKITGRMKKGIGFSGVLVHIVLVLLASVYIIPLLLPLLFAFKTPLEFAYNPWAWPKQFGLENFIEAWQGVKIDSGLLNTFIVCIGAIIFTVPCAAMAGYIFSNYRSFVTDILFYILMGGFFIPVQLVLIPLVKINATLGISGSLIGLILPIASFGIPFWTLIYRSFFNTIPKDFIEAARIDGAGNWRIFLAIILPLAKAATALALLLVFFGAWNDYLLSLILLNKQALFTLQLRVAMFIGQRGANFYPQYSAGLLIAVAPTVILYIIFHKQIIKGVSLAGAIKG